MPQYMYENKKLLLWLMMHVKRIIKKKKASYIHERILIYLIMCAVNCNGSQIEYQKVKRIIFLFFAEKEKKLKAG
jgi:hypothetical protein